MAARSLRCVAIAYRNYNIDDVPVDEQQLANWNLPEDDLVLLAIVGIKVLKYTVQSLAREHTLAYYIYFVYLLLILFVY